MNYNRRISSLFLIVCFFLFSASVRAQEVPETAKLQLIRIKHVTRLNLNNHEIMASGGAIFDNGVTPFHWNASVPLEIYFTFEPEKFPDICREALENDNYPVQILARGTGSEVKEHLPNGRVEVKGAFTLSHIAVCQIGDDVEKQDIHEFFPHTQ